MYLVKLLFVLLLSISFALANPYAIFNDPIEKIENARGELADLLFNKVGVSPDKIAQLTIPKGTLPELKINGKLVPVPSTVEELETFTEKVLRRLDKIDGKYATLSIDGIDYKLHLPALGQGERGIVFAIGDGNKVIKLPKPGVVNLMTLKDEAVDYEYWYSQSQKRDFHVPKREQNNRLGLFAISETVHGEALTTSLVDFDIVNIESGKAIYNEKAFSQLSKSNQDKLSKAILSMVKAMEENPNMAVSLAPNNIYVVYTDASKKVIDYVSLIDIGTDKKMMARYGGVKSISDYLEIAHTRVDKYLTKPHLLPPELAERMNKRTPEVNSKDIIRKTMNTYFSSASKKDRDKLYMSLYMNSLSNDVSSNSFSEFMRSEIPQENRGYLEINSKLFSYPSRYEELPMFVQTIFDEINRTKTEKFVLEVGGIRYVGKVSPLGIGNVGIVFELDGGKVLKISKPNIMAIAEAKSEVRIVEHWKDLSKNESFDISRRYYSDKLGLFSISKKSEGMPLQDFFFKKNVLVQDGERIRIKPESEWKISNVEIESLKQQVNDIVELNRQNPSYAISLNPNNIFVSEEFGDGNVKKINVTLIDFGIKILDPVEVDGVTMSSIAKYAPKFHKVLTEEIKSGAFKFSKENLLSRKDISIISENGKEYIVYSRYNAGTNFESYLEEAARRYERDTLRGNIGLNTCFDAFRLVPAL